MQQVTGTWLRVLSLFLVFIPQGWAQTFAVLYNFGSGGNQDPVQPSYSGIIAQGADGNLYSTAPDSYQDGYGAAFTITPSGALTVLYEFTSYSLGENPYSGLTVGTDGAFYGTTEYGGNNGDGTVFSLTPSGTLTVLYTFTGGSDGGHAFAPPIQGSDGNFYGTTTGGYYSKAPYGTVYKLSPTGSMTVLYQFDEQHGAYPYAPLIEGSDGNFYGVTSAGGNLNLGIVFKIAPSGKFRVLYNFDGFHGSQPFGPLVEGPSGQFYGTTFNGGTKGSGVIFKITAGGRLKVLHNFRGSGGGFYPVGGLLHASDGNFYGTTHSGGPVDAGTIYQISPQGKYAVLHRFKGTDGMFPLVTLMQHTNGILYGDTNEGGTVSCYKGNCGTFYSLDLGLPPFVSVLPCAGHDGDRIGILGQGFRGATSVSFNGIAASFNVVSDTFLTATVPGAGGTGFVMVNTPRGALKSKVEFRVTK
jgi:uncharacterized repeat protein (TIGR03803 family)